MDYTSELFSVQSLLKDYKRAKNKVSSLKRRLQTIHNRYSFLNRLVSVGGNDDLIVTAAANLFKNAGFEQVLNLKYCKPKREDLRIECTDCIILVECKGTSKPFPKDDELFQVKKYIDYRVNHLQSKLPVFGVIVLNYDNKKLVADRNPKPINKEKNDYAIASRIGIILSQDLVEGFIKVERGEITFDSFKNLLKEAGTIKF